MNTGHVHTVGEVDDDLDEKFDTHSVTSGRKNFEPIHKKHHFDNDHSNSKRSKRNYRRENAHGGRW